MKKQKKQQRMRKLILLLTLLLGGASLASAQKSNIQESLSKSIPQSSLDSLEKTVEINTPYSGKGNRNFFSAGYTFGSRGEWGNDVISGNYTQGYQFDPYLFLGIGVEFDYHKDLEALFVPIYADIRINLIKTPVCPFLDLKFGYSVVKSGLFFNPNLGIRFPATAKMAMNVSIGYVLQQAYVYNRWNPKEQADVDLKGFTLKVGLEI